MRTLPTGTVVADNLDELLDRFVGTVYSIRILRAPPDGRFLTMVPNRGSDYQPRPLTEAQVRQSFGPGTYLIEVVEPARMLGLFQDPVEQLLQSCGYVTVKV